MFFIITIMNQNFQRYYKTNVILKILITYNEKGI